MSEESLIYQLCPQCQGTGKNPIERKKKCSRTGCKDGYIPWGKIVAATREKKAK